MVLSSLAELQENAYRIILRDQLGLYKYNKNHDKVGRFASASGTGGAAAGPSEAEEARRVVRSQRAMGNIPKFGGRDLDPELLDGLWDDDAGWLGRQETMDAWTAMQPCKQMRAKAALLVGLTSDDKASTAVDPFRHAEAEWGGLEPIEDDDAKKAALQLLHQLHNNIGVSDQLPVNDVLWRASGVDPEVLKRALKTGDVFDLPLASFAGAHPALNNHYGAPDEDTGEKTATVLFQVKHPKAAIRGTELMPVWQSREDIPYEEWENGARVGHQMEMNPLTEEAYYAYMEDWQMGQHDGGEFISGGRFKVKSMKTRSVKGITNPGQKALVIELEHLGVFDPWTGEV